MRDNLTITDHSRSDPDPHSRRSGKLGDPRPPVRINVSRRVTCGFGLPKPLAKAEFLWHGLDMAQAALLEQPVVVHTRPAIEMDDEQFYQFCRVNRDLQIERTAEGDIVIMAPEAGSSGYGGTKLTAWLDQWAERDGSGRVFGSSTGFILPNGAVRSPDVAWVRNARLDVLTDRQWQRFLPLCPDFVLELRSPSDALARLQLKMEEYLQNGAQLGWLLDPVARQVHIYRPGLRVEIVDNPAEVTGAPLLEGFVLAVPRVWAAMQREPV